jgi:hypothetical protein
MAKHVRLSWNESDEDEGRVAVGRSSPQSVGEEPAYQQGDEEAGKLDIIISSLVRPIIAEKTYIEVRKAKMAYQATFCGSR